MNTEMNGVIETLEKARAEKRAELQAIERALEALTGAATLRNAYAGLGIVEATRRLLAVVGRPMPTKEIADTLLARGLTTKSKKFVPTVYATLRNANGFSRSGDFWELKSPSTDARGPNANE